MLCSVPGWLLSAGLLFMPHAAFFSCFEQQRGQNGALETEHVSSLLRFVQLNVLA